ncbi:hypothetical protein L1987_35047 [Smallanthus sonchifolius]|uniref:Uncharacterized protein n=1 Tax=Smallanthus sonchifolius TaxID=185202 RepID=A0ACB9HWA5_9ASTR|nr:hypothetical protein L1987_35047 [Smallanthus sonchifolius]
MEEDRYNVHEDEVIDTLSLSDFLIYEYDNNGDPQEFYKLDNIDNLDDQFEFSSDLLKTSVNNSVVFCGNIIPYKEPTISQNSLKLESKKLQKSHKHRWRLVRFLKRSSRSESKVDQTKRVSILASETKPRWYLFMFGFGSSSFTAQLQVRDLKKRQTSMGTKDRSDSKIGGGKGGGTGYWRLVKLLGCGGGGWGW